MRPGVYPSSWLTPPTDEQREGSTSYRVDSDDHESRLTAAMRSSSPRTDVKSDANAAYSGMVVTLTAIAERHTQDSEGGAARG
jgi:hypothetical protein